MRRLCSGSKNDDVVQKRFVAICCINLVFVVGVVAAVVIVETVIFVFDIAFVVIGVLEFAVGRIVHGLLVMLPTLRLSSLSLMLPSPSLLLSMVLPTAMPTSPSLSSSVSTVLSPEQFFPISDRLV